MGYLPQVMSPVSVTNPLKEYSITGDKMCFKGAAGFWGTRRDVWGPELDRTAHAILLGRQQVVCGP